MGYVRQHTAQSGSCDLVEMRWPPTDDVREELGQLGGGLALSLHAELHGANTSYTKPALKTAHHAAKEEAVMLHLGNPVFVLDRKHAAKHIGVAPDVLSAGVHDDVGAKSERVLKWRRSEGGVDDKVSTT